jgi:hypothetical protein
VGALQGMPARSMVLDGELCFPGTGISLGSLIALLGVVFAMIGALI